jgi:ABC-type amino acid transport system permease subunit
MTSQLARRSRQPLPLPIRVYTGLVLVELIARAFFPPTHLLAGAFVGVHVLVVIGLMRRVELARLAALFFGMVGVIQGLPLLIALLFTGWTGPPQLWLTVLVLSALNTALGGYMLFAFNSRALRQWTARSRLGAVPRRALPPVTDP